MFDGIVDAVKGVTGAVGSIVDPIQGLVSGGLSMLGGSSANKAAWDRQMASQEYNSSMTQAQMDFQERMRKTQYQTTVQDLMAAGLNPMLAYSQGGAGNLAGASASSSPAPVHDAISPAVSAYQNARQTAADLQLKQEQATATTAQAEVSRTQALANIAETAKKEQDTKTGAAVENVNRMQLDAIAAEIAFKNQATRTSSAQAGLATAQTKKQMMETEAGIVSSNPITQGWAEFKRGGNSFTDKWNPKFESLNSALKAKQQRQKNGK